ncbi:MAG: hypothetical protein KGZ57_06660 [Dethiobacter sp.]|nr:hypothetical protein [Dethiobacter sp.]MCL5981043.1 DUF166 domain-containing protein [Bacillota bacterium]
MKMLVLLQGVYGKRVADHLRAKAPQEWGISTWIVPAISEPIVDEPEAYLPPEEMAADLILHLAETPQAAQLLPAVTQKSGARAVIVAIDNSAWLPPGLRRQLQRELELLGVTVVFAEPLCSLDTETVGYGDSLAHYANADISQFARHFGKPVLDVQLDREGNIAGVQVLRGSPCGSTEYTAGLVLGLAAEKAVPASGLMCLSYPCYASMKFTHTERGIDTIMHNSGRIFNEGMARALKSAAKK